MDMDEVLFKNFIKVKGLGKSTEKMYRERLMKYAEYHDMSWEELINEAEEEEELGVRWRKRKLRERLLDYRMYLMENYVANTFTAYFNSILTFYRFYEIEVNKLPPIMSKSLIRNRPISYSDLPDKDIIKKAIDLSNPLMKALILFMSSSGCARAETLSLTVHDFIKATKEYHGKNHINEVLPLLEGRDDIIPTFKLRRIKTDKHYYTFCSPEATDAIVSYLISRENVAKVDKLFKVTGNHLQYKFTVLNDKMKLGRVNKYGRFRTHMLRKFHASQLFNSGMSKDEVDSLQGRKDNSTHQAYFFENPVKLKEKYIEHMDAVTINWNINNISFKSSEYLELETKYENKKEENKIMKEKVETFESRLKKLENFLNEGFQ